MNVITSIRRFTAKLLGARLKEDVFPDFEDDERDHHNYRKIGARGFRSALRDLPRHSQDEQNRQANKAYIENPFIRRIAKMVAEFIVGNGVSVVSPNKQVQEELSGWWEDPVNNWEKRHFTLAIELPLFGEQIMERVVNQFTGRHRYNWLDPLFVADVKAHPKFPAVPASINFWQNFTGGASGGTGSTINAKILNGVPEEPLLAGIDGGIEDPLVFYFRTNNLSGALRGHSHYYPLFEWADILDQAGFTMGERMVILMTYVWHLKANNMDAKQKATWRNRLENAGPCSVLITKPDVSLDAVTPDLKSADFTEGARFLRNLIAGAAGVPEHFMGEGGDVNRATAVAMSMPTLRSFLQLQREYVTVIRTLARANLVSVASRGRIPASEVDNFTVQVDPMNPADTGIVATSLGSLVTSLEIAVERGWVTDKEAQQTIRNVLGGIVELDDDIEDPEALAGLQLPPETAKAIERIRRRLNGEQVEEPANGATPATPATRG